MSDLIPIKRALLSVSDKAGLVELGQALAAHGVELLSTGGSAKTLRDAGLDVKDVSEHTGFPEMMDGRVKTLHPKVHGGLLALRDKDTHIAAMTEHGIGAIDMICVNLYPFEATVARGAEAAEVIENIDIGGPAMIRSAAKNHKFVTVITDVEDYDAVLNELKTSNGATTLGLRTHLAAKAYARTASYDSAISAWFLDQQDENFPSRYPVAGEKAQDLRYGENPHQVAAFYKTAE
ncbi:MAG: bifunctional phosphoribosylaminoimidazolecarboxamide formyltransferase/IMP cyclohydrolase, partial [Sphingomonadales bacterium]|nr:bifunctional phosphoribosylaminoimidazolecarboxamide formyltransferase/IMP cyclohydrolase [Sphingomonadales bacterium]